MSNLWSWVGTYFAIVTVVRALFIGQSNVKNYRSALAAFTNRWGFAIRTAASVDPSAAFIDVATTEQLKVSRWESAGEAVIWAGTRLSARWFLRHGVESNLIATSTAGPAPQIIAVERFRLLGTLAERSEPAAVAHHAALSWSPSPAVVAVAKRYSDNYSDGAYEQAGRIHQMAYFMAGTLGLLLTLVSCHLTHGAASNAVLSVIALGGLGGVVSFAMRLLRSGEGVGGDNALQWSRLLLAQFIGGASAIAGVVRSTALTP
jgi:hypothetical protein